MINPFPRLECHYLSKKYNRYDELSLTYCNHVSNRDKHEGNCNEKWCPLMVPNEVSIAAHKLSYYGEIESKIPIIKRETIEIEYLNPEWLRFKRKDRQYTYKLLGKLLGVSPSYLCDVEKGRRKMTKMKTMVECIKLLTCDITLEPFQYDIIEKGLGDIISKTWEEQLLDNVAEDGLCDTARKLLKIIKPIQTKPLKRK